MTRSFLSVRSVPGKPGHQGWSGGDVEALPPSSANGNGGKWPRSRPNARRKNEGARPRRGNGRNACGHGASPTVSGSASLSAQQAGSRPGPCVQLREFVAGPVHDGDGTLRSLEFLNRGGKKF